MTNFIVLSDTHGNRHIFDELSNIIAEHDGIIHLGDTSADGIYLQRLFPDKQIILINGNCDPIKLGNDERILEIEGVKIFLTHGHLYGVKQTLDKLAYRAKELDCQVALYGHTHNAQECEVGGVLTFNPGCLNKYSYKSYGFLSLHQGKIVTKIVYLN